MARIWITVDEKISASSGVLDVGTADIKTTGEIQAPQVTLATDTTIANSSGDIVYSVASGKKNSFVVDSTEEFVINSTGGANA